MQAAARRTVVHLNVVASAILWSGTPRMLLQAARDRRIEIFTRTAMPAGLTDILGRQPFTPGRGQAGWALRNINPAPPATERPARPAEACPVHLEVQKDPPCNCFTV